MATLVDIGRSLAASGITRVLFVNGHGGNSALGQVANRELRRRFGLRTFFTHPGVPVDQGGTGSAPSEYGMGVHGGHGETSLMLHLRPDLVRMELARANVPTALREYRHIGFGKPVSFGWTSDGPLKADKTPAIPAAYVHETHPVNVGADPAYADGSGTNIVRYEVPLTAFATKNLVITATLYYQSIPPYFLNDRFSQAPNGPATQRLYYLTSNLQTKGTPIENWKVQIVKASEAVAVP